LFQLSSSCLILSLSNPIFTNSLARIELILLLSGTSPFLNPVLSICATQGLIAFGLIRNSSDTLPCANNALRGSSKACAMFPCTDHYLFFFSCYESDTAYPSGPGSKEYTLPTLYNSIHGSFSLPINHQTPIWRWIGSRRRMMTGNVRHHVPKKPSTPVGGVSLSEFPNTPNPCA